MIIGLIMKKVLWIICLFTALIYMSACHDEDVSYLDVSAMEYPVNSMTVVVGLTMDDTLIMVPPAMPWDQPSYPYKKRLKNNAPWVAQGFYGATVEGARPLTITLESVKATGEKADADVLKEELVIVGEGRLELPLYTKVPVGEYLLSLRVANVSGSDVVEDAFTIVVTDKK